VTHLECVGCFSSVEFNRKSQSEPQDTCGPKADDRPPLPSPQDVESVAVAAAQTVKASVRGGLSEAGVDASAAHWGTESALRAVGWDTSLGEGSLSSFSLSSSLPAAASDAGAAMSRLGASLGGSPEARDAARLGADVGRDVALLAGDAGGRWASASNLVSARLSAAAADVAAGPVGAVADAFANGAKATADLLASSLLDLSALADAPVDAPLLAAAGDLHTLAAFATTAAILGASAARAWADRAAADLEGSARGRFDVDTALPRTYDVAALRSYYKARPAAYAARALETAFALGPAVVGMLQDRRDTAAGRTDLVAAREPKRAKVAREAIERLGPAYVKVAQVLSTRGDILSPAYVEEVTKLQDRVAPFSTDDAMEMLREDLGGRDPSDVFSELSSAPVAAASLGQVYRGKLRETGEEVAVKVQRPRVLERVALDLFVLREACDALYRDAPDWLVGSRRTDIVPVLDEWAVSFFREMDYTYECRQADVFAKSLADAGVEGVVVPKQHPELSSRRVLVSGWVDGERLVESTADDVRALCDTLLNCYLVQLLDTGILHADPHPGNLLRTPEGKIAILDFGLMTEVAPDKQWAFVEYIGHLCTANWRGVAVDLVNLGFAPAGYETLVEIEGFTDLIESVLSVIISGGGAAKVKEAAEKKDIGKVLAQLEDLSKEYKFEIPPYFALILRAFSVIEGIALRVDPDYAIVTECFPYLSRRLLRDGSPRARGALRELLYGRAEGGRIDLARFQKLADGFGAYTTDGLVGAPSSLPSSSLSPPPGLDRVGTDALRAVLAPHGSPLADLLIDELAFTLASLGRSASAGAAARLVAAAALPGGAGGGVTSAGRTSSFLALPGTSSERGGLDVLPPAFFLPPPLPVALARLPETLAPTEDDRVALSNVRVLLQGLSSLASAQGGSTTAASFEFRPDADAARRLLDETSQLARDIAPGLARAGGRLGAETARVVAARVADDMQAVGRVE